MKDKKRTNTIIISIIILLVLVITTGTYAWGKWYGNTNTNITFSVNNMTITYTAGSDISVSNFMPVSVKESGIVKNIQVKMNSSNTGTLSLVLKINSLTSGLKDQSFLWEIYKDSNRVGHGNFLNAVAGNNIELFNDSYNSTSNNKYYRNVTTTLDTYTLYIWIDGANYTNPPAMVENQSFSFSVSGSGVGGNQIVAP